MWFRAVLVRQCETVSDTPLAAAILGRCSTALRQPDLCIYWTTDAEPEPEVEPPQPPPRPKQTVCWDDAAGFVHILLAMTTEPEPEPEVEPPQPPPPLQQTIL